MQDPGYIYVFRDHLNNNLIKVGLSKNPIARQRQLHTTGTALPMTPYCIWRVGEMRLAEKAAHEVLRGHRVNPRREFFEIAPAQHFDEFERASYDITSIYLDALLELIEEGMDYLEIAYERIHNERDIT